MGERVFVTCLVVSVGLHLSLLIGQLVVPDWFKHFRARRALTVIYEYEVAERELRHLQEQLRRSKRDTAAAPSPSAGGERREIRIPDRPLLDTLANLSEIMPGRSTIIDLTNVVACCELTGNLGGEIGFIKARGVEPY